MWHCYKWKTLSGCIALAGQEQKCHRDQRGCTRCVLCCVKRRERPTSHCILDPGPGQGTDVAEISSNPGGCTLSGAELVYLLREVHPEQILWPCFPLVWWSVTVLVHRHSSQEYFCLRSARMRVVIKINLNYRRVTERKQNYYWLKTQAWLSSVEEINQIYGTMETTWWQTFGKCQQWKVLVCVGWH